MKESIVLMGIKHCGKSTQGRILSEKLGLPFFDTDSVMEEMAGKTPREIYSKDGEEKFKNWEFMACEKIHRTVLKNKKDAVIATGGGICNNPKAVEELKKFGKIIFLKSAEKTACDRIVREIKYEGSKMTNLPAYIAKKNPHTENDVRIMFHEFYEERTLKYKKLADITVEMLDSTKQENADKILCAI